MSDQLELRYIPLSTVRRWDRNPKKHDMGALAASIERYGFKDPPAFDPSLNTGTGGIVEGNGRAECLTWMKQQKKHAPRGVLVDKDEWLIPVLFGVDAPSQAAAEAYGVDHNNLTMAGGEYTAVDISRMWGDGFADVLGSLADLGELPITFDADDLDLLLHLGDLPSDAAPSVDEPPRASLADRFGVPPFSVLDARQGYWQARKKAWIALGLKGEEGRGGNSLGLAAAVSGQSNYAKGQTWDGFGAIPGGGKGDGGANSVYTGASRWAGTRGGKRGLARTNGQDLMRGEGTNALPGKMNGTPLPVGQGGQIDRLAHKGEWRRSKNSLAERISRAKSSDVDTLMAGVVTSTEGEPTGTSIMDPVLCELAYRWFCPKSGHVINPTAGESVYGIVAAYLGYKYTGVELRPEQVAANRQQAIDIGVDPVWIQGDGREVATLIEQPADFIMCCPPYADLEVYSDDPQDISTLEYDEFLIAYRQIIAGAVSLLKQDRFACFVVGDIRDKKGLYRNFVSETIAAFHATGMALYNEAILVTSVGSLPIRVGKQFTAGRKLGKTHQNVLIFVKGDPKKATEACGEVDVSFPEGFYDEP